MILIGKATDSFYSACPHTRGDDPQPLLADVLR